MTSYASKLTLTTLFSWHGRRGIFQQHLSPPGRWHSWHSSRRAIFKHQHLPRGHPWMALASASVSHVHRGFGFGFFICCGLGGICLLQPRSHGCSIVFFPSLRTCSIVFFPSLRTAYVNVGFGFGTCFPPPSEDCECLGWVPCFLAVCPLRPCVFGQGDDFGKDALVLK